MNCCCCRSKSFWFSAETHIWTTFIKTPIPWLQVTTWMSYNSRCKTRSVSATTEVGMKQQVEFLLVPHRSMHLCTHPIEIAKILILKNITSVILLLQRLDFSYSSSYGCGSNMVTYDEDCKIISQYLAIIWTFLKYHFSPLEAKCVITCWHLRGYQQGDNCSDMKGDWSLRPNFRCSSL